MKEWKSSLVSLYTSTQFVRCGKKLRSGEWRVTRALSGTVSLENMG